MIFIQSGPRRVGSTLASRILGGRDWNAGCGDYCQDTPGVLSLGKPIKEICRELHLSRKVARKVIRSNATEFHYERSRQPLPRIGPWRQRLESLLEENESKAAREGSGANGRIWPAMMSAELPEGVGMSKLMGVEQLFEGRHFDREVIILDALVSSLQAGQACETWWR